MGKGQIRFKKMPKESKSKQKVHKSTMEFAVCWPANSSVGACLRCGDIPLEKTDFTFDRGYHVQIASSLVGDETLCSLHVSILVLEPHPT